MKLLHGLFFLIMYNASSGQSVVIDGAIVDSIEKRPLASANILIKDQNGNILKSAVSDKDGNFLIGLPDKTATTITVSYVQYNSKDIVIVFKDGNINLGKILLTVKAGSLAEVIVQGKKAPVAFRVDRQVFKASQFGNAAGGTGTDLIRNLPAISVNGQGDISFRGSGSFLLLLNGKPTQGDPSFVLSQLAASSIENIEVITSPSAAYDADGKSGIINIVTKTGTQDGWMVQANVMGGAPPIKDYGNRRNPVRFGSDISVGYRKNKLDVSAGLNYLRNDIAGYREGDVYTITGNTKTSFPSVGERSFNRTNYGGRMAVSYQINKTNTISAGFYRGKKYQSRVADLMYQITRKNLLNGTTTGFNYFNENDQQKEGVFTLTNVDYTHDFSELSKISFSALYEKADLSSITSNNNIAGRGSKDTLQYTVNPTTNPLNAFRFKTDYTKKIGKGNFQAGYQYRYDVQNGDFRYLISQPGTGNFITDPQFTSRVRAINHIHAGYLQYAGVVEKLNYSAGLRVEQSDRDLSFSKDDEKLSQNLTNFFPSLQFRYNVWNKGMLKAGYSRRIKRTNNYELNPFPEREHSETLEQGDPNLLPELIGTFETGLEQSFSKGSLYATIYYQQVKNPIQRVNKVFNDTILNRVYTNAGNATQFGMETNFTSQVNNWWSSAIGGNLYKYSIKGNIFGGAIAVNNSNWVYSFNSTQTFTLPKNWMLQLSINYLSEKATAQGEDSRFLTPHFTVKKTSGDKRWSVQLQWLNMDAGMLQSNRQRITTYGADFYSTTNYIYEPDQIQFSVGFNLSKKNRKIILPVSEMGEKEF